MKSQRKHLIQNLLQNLTEIMKYIEIREKTKISLKSLLSLNATLKSIGYLKFMKSERRFDIIES